MIFDVSGTAASPYAANGAEAPSAYRVNGGKIYVRKHTPDIEPVVLFKTLSPQPSAWVQGGAVWDGTLVIAETSGLILATLEIYDFQTGVRLGQAELSGSSCTYHANTIAFAPNLHGGNDSFPYLFISEYYGNGTIGVFDLSEEDGVYTATEIQTIDFSGVSGDIIGHGYNDFMLDFEDSRLFVVRYNLAGSYQAEVGNTTIISEFALPEITGTDVVLTTDDVLSHHEVSTLIYARQETVYERGFAYILAGGSGSGKLYLVDCNSWTDEVVNLQATVSNEPETLCFTNNRMYVVDNSGNIFEFSY